MTTATQIVTITVPAAVEAGGNRLDAGEYTVRIPADYDAEYVTGEDILLDGDIVIVIVD